MIATVLLAITAEPITAISFLSCWCYQSSSSFSHYSCCITNTDSTAASTSPHTSAKLFPARVSSISTTPTAALKSWGCSRSVQSLDHIILHTSVRSFGLHYIYHYILNIESFSHFDIVFFLCISVLLTRLNSISFNKHLRVDTAHIVSLSLQLRFCTKLVSVL